ncbi:MAG: HprK-related kinase A [Alphaproteobacteria bacterium]|nr:HprK-related kinase A [Alphaproteobacteria bacterium]
MTAKQHEVLQLRLGPFTAALATGFTEVIDALGRLYPAQFRQRAGDFADFHVALVPGKGVRRYLRPQARFLIDGQDPFKPLPACQALPLVEWGLNYAIAGLAHQYLIVHAAALEKNGRVAVLPGVPGSGKSTLAAGLVHRGWRLLSDELALIRRDDGQVVPLARPINLKNASIDVLKAFAPDAVFSDPVSDTVKGTVVLMRAPEDSLARVDEVAPVGWIVFPQWRAGAPARFEPFSKAAGLIEVGHHAMNYSLHGAQGFGLLAQILEGSGCYRFAYGDLNDAASAFDALAAAA